MQPRGLPIIKGPSKNDYYGDRTFTTAAIMYNTPGSLGALADRPLLPQVLPSSTPRILPPILKGAGMPPSPTPTPSQPPSLTHTPSLPSYQESSLRRQFTTASTSSLPPNYYGGTGTEGGGAGQQQRRVRLDFQELSDNPIHVAAMEGVAISQMKSLALQFGVDYQDSGGRTSLMYAVIGNQPKMCELLLKLKALVNSKDLTGLTPLLWATYKAHADIIRVLLKYEISNII